MHNTLNKMIISESLDTFIKKMSHDPNHELLLTGIPEALADRFLDSFFENVNLNLYSDDMHEGSYNIVIWKEGGEIQGYSLNAEDLSDRSYSSGYMVYRLASDPQSQLSKATYIINELLKESDEEEEDEEAEEKAAELKDIAWAADHAEDSSEFPTERSPEQWYYSTPTIFDTKDLEDQLP